MKKVKPNILVRNLMNPEPVSLRRGPLGRESAVQLLSGLYSGIPVVNEKGELIGLVTERNVLHAMGERKDIAFVRVEDIMTVPPLWVEEDTSADLALQIFIQQKVNWLPVARRRKLVGVIRRAEILRYLLDLGPDRGFPLSTCYWCEKVCDEEGLPSKEKRWCDLRSFLKAHHLSYSDVNLIPTYCPACFRYVRKVSASNGMEDKPWIEKAESMKRILVVDDDSTISNVLCDTLSPWGYEVVTASNGREALQVVETSDVNGMLLDLEMPIMDGWTMLDELHWRGYHLPIILMSGGANPQSLKDLLKEGAQGYLLKPFDLDYLQRECEKVFGEPPIPRQSDHTSCVP